MPPRVLICPFCGATQAPSERCERCDAGLDPNSRRAAMALLGPWFVRDDSSGHLPGMSYDALARMVERGRIRKYTIVRGPTTRQLWTVARHARGVAHLLGYCHACDGRAKPEDEGCHLCGASFLVSGDPSRLLLDEDASLSGSWGGDLSAFATNAILGVGAARQPAATLAQRDTSTVREKDPAPPPLETADARIDLPTLHVERALRRTINGQRRTIRMLGALLFVSTMFALGGIWIAVSPQARELLGAGHLESSAPTNPSASDHVPAKSAAAAAAAAPREPLLPAAVEPSIDALSALRASVDRLADPGGASLVERRDGVVAALAEADALSAQPAINAESLRLLRERLETLLAKLELEIALNADE